MGNVHMEATQINYRGGSKKMSVEEAIKAAGTEITPEEKEWIDTIPELASQEIIAPEFDAEEGVYAVGDLVIYQGGLYKFTTAHETAGAWNPEEVAAVKVSEELSSLESGLTNLNNKVTGLHNAVVFDRALTSIDVDIFESNLIWLVGFECAINANTPCGGLYVLVKQGTYISLTALKEVGTPGLSVAIKSSNVLTFSWTAVDDFGGNITMMPMIFWHD